MFLSSGSSVVDSANTRLGLVGTLRNGMGQILVAIVYISI